MGLLAWMVAGLIAGGLARRVTGTERMGCLATMVVGILGGLIGGALFNAAAGEGITGFNPFSLFIAFIGACALLLVLQAFTPRRD